MVRADRRRAGDTLAAQAASRHGGGDPVRRANPMGIAAFRNTQNPPAAEVIFMRSPPHPRLRADRGTTLSEEERQMQKSLSIDPAKCTGCLQCEMACSYENYGVFNPRARASRYSISTRPAARCRTRARSATRRGAFTPAGGGDPRSTRPRARRSCSRRCASAARCARSRVPSGRSTTSRRPARYRSATSAATTRVCRGVPHGRDHLHRC